MPANADPIVDLMARCISAPAHERAALLERLGAEHPDLASELRRRFEVLRAMGLGDLLVSDEPAGAPEPVPERLGEFRLLERLGGGGMGVVYRAEQTSLGREVALKLVRPELVYFPGARARFRREVEAVARLKHPGIVPVYAVGEERGLPWFAMELVEGCTLAELLSALAGRAPAGLSGADLALALRARGVEPEAACGAFFALGWVDACLALSRDVADALAHAHSRGIVHRDVKPSNVILTARGRAVLFDFGLTSSAGAERLTHTGAQPGTPLYMAPEQVRGGSVDARADVYALGVTLHELLALEPRYQGRDSSALRAAILDGSARSLGERNPRVPRDVEAIVRVATDVAPERRYPEAAFLARDLENALARRPVVARPPGPWLSAARWVRRHPALSTAVVSGLALLAGIPLALYLQQRNHSAALGALLAEQKAAAERERVLRTEQESATQDAETTLAFMTNLFLAATPERLGGRTFDVKAFLDESLAHIDQIAGRPGVVGRVLFLAGEVYEASGELDRAIEVLERAVEIERELFGLRSKRTLEGLAHLGGALLNRGRLEEAQAVFEEELAARIDLLGADHLEVATSHGNLAAVLCERGDLSGAELELRRGLEILDRTVEVPPESALPLQGNLAMLVFRQGRPQEALELAEQFAAQARREDSIAPLSLARLLVNLGMLRRTQGNGAGSLEVLREAVELLDHFHPDGHWETALAENNLGVALKGEGELQEAVRHFERAVSMMEALELTDHPHFPGMERELESARAALTARE